MANKLSNEIINKIPVLYEEYKNKTKVAQELGISVASVNKYLAIAALPIEQEKKERKKRVKITDEIIQQINDEYAKCKNMNEVARRLGIAATTVKKYLSEDNLKLINQEKDDRDALWFYIYRLFGKVSDDKPVSDWNITQMIKFRGQGMPYRGQLLTLKYFYEIKKSPLEKSRGSIGIIPYIYEEARLYYIDKEQKQKEMMDAIQRQLEKDRVEIKFNPADYMSKRKKKKEIDLNSI